MFKQTIGTYWKNMRYLVLVMGMIFITLLVSTSVFARNTMQAVSEVSTQISEYIESNSLSFAEVGEAVQKGRNFFEALGKVLENYAGLMGTFVTGAGAGAAKIAGALAIFIAIFIVGLFISHDVVFIMARYDKKNRGILETWFELVIKRVFITAYHVLMLYFFSVPFLEYTGVAFLVLVPVALCFLAILGEWLAAGKNRPAFKSVVTFKNVLILLGENALAILFSLILFVFVTVVAGVLMGVFLGFALCVLTGAAMSLNAQAFLFGKYACVDCKPETIAAAEEKAEEITEAKPEEITEAIQDDDIKKTEKVSEQSTI